MVIKFKDVNYKLLFENINVEIKEEHITSIVGKNGSGKTSFLRLIYGLGNDFLGKIVIGRKNITSKTKRKELDKLRENIFYLSQVYQEQLFNINIFEDIKYGINKINNQVLNDLLTGFNLNEEILNKTYAELSDGEIKKILIISMIISKKKILLLDDPTSGLDQKSISTLIKLLKREKRKGKTIILTSQDVDFLINISDSIYIIDGGKILVKENKYEFFSNYELLDKCNLEMPNVVNFREYVLKTKNVKLVYRDNINDLIKDIYRNVK